MRHLSVCLLLVIAGVSPATAQVPVETTKFVLRPAAEPRPALKYQLLPRADEITAGNAVQVYYRAFSPEWFTNVRKSDVRERIENALTTPLKNLDRKGLSWLLDSSQLREVDLGARREYCDWEFTDR